MTKISVRHKDDKLVGHGTDLEKDDDILQVSNKLAILCLKTKIWLYETIIKKLEEGSSIEEMNDKFYKMFGVDVYE